jgi:hypothetical protein
MGRPPTLGWKTPLYLAAIARREAWKRGWGSKMCGSNSACRAQKSAIHLPHEFLIYLRIHHIRFIFVSSYTEVYSVIYDSGPVPDWSIFSPRESSTLQGLQLPTLLACFLDEINFMRGHTARRRAARTRRAARKSPRSTLM